MIQICPRCREVSTFVETEKGRVRCNKCKKELWAYTIKVLNREDLEVENQRD